MSDENRNEAGQFASAEPAFGLEGVEREAGYTPFKEEKAEDEAGGELTVREAADEVVAQHQGTAESDIRRYSPLDDLADNVTLTLEQASKMLSDEHAADTKAAEEAEADRLRAEVDELRGVKPEAAEKESGAKAAEPPTPAVEGELDPEIEKALNNPKIQAAISQHVGEVEAARQHHVAGLNAATQIAQATFMAQFPEFAHIPAERMGEAVQAMIQQDPARAAQVAAAIQRTSGLFEQQRIAHQQAEQAKARRFTEYAKASDARFEQLAKDVPAETMKQVPTAIIEAIKGYGGDPQAFFEQYKTSEFLRDPIVQRMMVDVAQHRMIRDAKKAVARQDLPPVQRPGTARPSGQGVDSDRIQTLTRKSELSVAEATELYMLQSSRQRKAS